MSESATSLVLPTLADELGRQQLELAASAVSGLRTLVIGPATTPLPEMLVEAAAGCEQATIASFIDEAQGEHQAIVSLDDIEARHAVAFARAIAQRARAGVRIVVGVDPAVGGLIQPLLAGATVLSQRVAGVAWLAAEGSGQSLPAVEAAHDGATERRRFFILGWDEAPAPPPSVAAGLPYGVWADAVARGNVALRTANRRLSGAKAPRESAAAAAQLGRVVALEQRHAEMERELEAAAERLALETRIAQTNDELFQEARRVIALREEEIAGLHATLARRAHRLAAGLAWRLDRLRRVGSGGRGREQPPVIPEERE
jgi:hypothetical protein